MIIIIIIIIIIMTIIIIIIIIIIITTTLETRYRDFSKLQHSHVHCTSGKYTEYSAYPLTYRIGDYPQLCSLTEEVYLELTKTIGTSEFFASLRQLIARKERLEKVYSHNVCGGWGEFESISCARNEFSIRPSRGA